MRAESIGRSNARVWQIGAKFYLKVGAAGEVAEEADRLRWFAGRAPVPRVIVYERVGDESYLLTQALDGVAAHAVTSIDSKPCLRSPRDCGCCMRLDVRTCPFDARLSVTMAKARDNALAGRVDESDFDDSRLGRTALDLLGELEATRPESEDLVVTHGDYCLPNVIVARRRRRRLHRRRPRRRRRPASGFRVRGAQHCV